MVRIIYNPYGVVFGMDNIMPFGCYLGIRVNFLEGGHVCPSNPTILGSLY